MENIGLPNDPGHSYAVTMISLVSAFYTKKYGNVSINIVLQRLFWISLLLLVVCRLPAQIRPTGPPTGPPDRPPGGMDPEAGERGMVEEEFDDRDTFGVFSFFSDNPNQETPFSDSLLSDYYHQYDPVRQRAWDYANLGIVGSAHLPLVYESRFRKGLDVGYGQYDLYLTAASELPYYRLEKAYTNLAYMQGGEQSDAQVTAQFSRNFANGLNYTLDYNRIAQKGELNQYPRQNNDLAALVTGMWIHGKNDRYDGFAAFAANTVEHEDHGGIIEEPQLEGFTATPSSAQVNLNEAKTRHQHREYAYTHYYRFGGGVDTLTGQPKRAFTLSHRARYQRSQYKYTDVALDEDAGYYGAFQVDPRGVRHLLKHNQFQNEFRLSTFKLRADSTSKERKQRDLLELGLSHTYHRLDQEVGDTVINNLFASGQFSFNPNDRLRVQAYAHLGLWGNAGDYRASGTLFFDLKNLGRLQVEAVNQLYNPAFTQTQFAVSQRRIWDNDFKKTLETSLTGTYSLPKFNFSVSGGYHLLNNYIYYDTLARPVQTGVPVSIFQLLIRKDFRVWHLHLDNSVALQQSTEEFLRLPGIFGKHSFYYLGKWFGVLNVKFGLDLRYNNTYRGYYYHPLTGQFRLEDQREIDFYPAVDAFFAMRVTRFRAYIKYENLTNAWTDDRLFYQVAYYAQPIANIRFGIKWRFVD